MVAVAVVSLLLLFGFGLPPRTFSLGNGHVDIPIVFIVSDADSGRAIDGASIHLRDIDLPEVAEPPYTVDLKTGPDGRASVSLNLQFNNSWDPQSGKLLSFHILYPLWTVRVEDQAHLEFTASFSDYERENPRFHLIKDTPPPPVNIRLRRQARLLDVRGVEQSNCRD